MPRDRRILVILLVVFALVLAGGIFLFADRTADASYRLEWAEGYDPSDGYIGLATKPTPEPWFGFLPTPKPKPQPQVSRPVARQGGPLGPSTNRYVQPNGCEADHSQQWSPSRKYWGKYQFDKETWAAHGGDPNQYGSAPVEEQDRVAANVKYDAWPNC